MKTIKRKDAEWMLVSQNAKQWVSRLVAFTVEGKTNPYECVRKGFEDNYLKCDGIYYLNSFKYACKEIPYKSKLTKGERITLAVDGNMVCAHFKNFINLQESPAGFGETSDGAIKNLLKEKNK